MRDPESRLDEIESRLAFQDDLVESLSRTVADQDRELERLRRHVSDLQARLAELADAASLPGAAPGHELPPHY